MLEGATLEIVTRILLATLDADNDGCLDHAGAQDALKFLSRAPPDGGPKPEVHFACPAGAFDETGQLRMPPNLSFALFKELEPRVKDEGAFMDAAIEYVEYARDANDLFALALLSRTNGGNVEDYLDRSLVAFRGADKALRRMVPLLPS